MRPNNNRNKNHGRRGGRRPNNRGGGEQSIGKQKSHATNQKERYSNMARDAAANGERVDAEFYNQHVEHYSRILNAIAEKEAERNAQREEKKPEPAAAANEEAAEADSPSDEKADSKPRRKPAPRKKAEEEIALPESALPAGNEEAKDA